MKTYLVQQENPNRCEAPVYIGTFSTREAAEAALKEDAEGCDLDPDLYEILEREVR